MVGGPKWQLRTVSRYRQLKKQRRKGLPRPNVEGLAASEPSIRGSAARSCCPCRVGWDAYEANRDAVEALVKDEDAVVRFNALHVRLDAVQAEALSERKQSARDANEARERERARLTRQSAVRTAARNRRSLG